MRVGTRAASARNLSRMHTHRSVASSVPKPSFELHRAQSPEDWRRVGALRYKALLARQDIPENAAEAYGDFHDRAFNCQAYLLARLGRPAATTRSSLSSASRRWPLPSMECFQKELSQLIARDLTVLEVSLTAVDAMVAEPRTAVFHLFKAHLLRCAIEEVDWMLKAVPEAQIGFYRRMFNMRILSGAEVCQPLALPRVLMGLDVREERELLRKRMPMLAATPDEEREFAETGKISFA